ncbi:hypothetical protein [Maricaulis sp.]|uniref:hypothetical protein n=1 Tax=Maricaulis sp. TaxID=1486257 RepID=UPI00262C7B72|nr:hypothetical protein [Maricaulis sp.]
MMFLIRAAFWLAIVSVFVPRDFAGEAFDLPFDLAQTRIDAAEPVDGWCKDNAAICEAGREAVRLGGFLTDMAANRIEAALDEREETGKS